MPGEFEWFCRHCGYYLPSGSPPQQQQAEETPCNCPARYYNLEDANFCQFCGQTLFTPGSWNLALVAESGDPILGHWAASRIERNMGDDEEKGILGLTSRKLLWVVPSSLTDAHRLKMAIPLEEIADVSPHVSEDIVTVMQGKSFRTFRLSVEDLLVTDSGQNVGQGNAAAFKKAVMSRAELRRSEIEESRSLSRIEVVKDFSFLREFMEKGGLVIQKIACTSCGAAMPLPESGNRMSCKYCRTEYHIEDIFEKVKQLMEITGKKNL